jgi:hypothetical protein
MLTPRKKRVTGGAAWAAVLLGRANQGLSRAEDGRLRRSLGGSPCGLTDYEKVYQRRHFAKPGKGTKTRFYSLDRLPGGYG